MYAKQHAKVGSQAICMQWCVGLLLSSHDDQNASSAHMTTKMRQNCPARDLAGNLAQSAKTAVHQCQLGTGTTQTHVHICKLQKWSKPRVVGYNPEDPVGQ